MRRIGSLSAAVALVLLTGCTPNLSEFRSSEGGFSILMPSNPEAKSLNLHGLHMKMYGKDVDRNGAMAVGYADTGGRSLDLGGCAGGVANTHGGKVVFNRPVTQNGHVGREFEVEISKPKKGYCSGRVFEHKKRFYLILAVGSDYKLSDSTVQKFLDSFKIER